MPVVIYDIHTSIHFSKFTESFSMTEDVYKWQSGRAVGACTPTITRLKKPMCSQSTDRESPASLDTELHQELWVQQSMNLDRTCCVLMHQGQSAENHTHHVRRSRTFSQPSCCLGRTISKRVGCCFVKPQRNHHELVLSSMQRTVFHTLGDFTQHTQLSLLNI